MIFLSFWAGLAVFGFQRFYGKIAMWQEKIFWKQSKAIRKDLIKELQQGKNFYKKNREEHRPDSIAFLVPLVFYIGVPIITLLLSARHPVLGIGSWVAIMMFVLICLYDD